MLASTMHASVMQSSSMLMRTRPAIHTQSTGSGARLACPAVHQVKHKCSTRPVSAASAISVGDQLPGDNTFSYFDADGAMQEISVETLTKDKKVVLFAVPGAFTPTCSLRHLPGFVEKAHALKEKGVDTVACIAVNDAFVLDAWGKSVGADGKILLLADGSALFTKAIGVDLDLTEKGLGIRSRRYAMLVENGEVTDLNLEEGGAFTVSSADQILSGL